MVSIKDGFLQSINQGYKDYLEHGARSNKKLFAPHQWIADTLKKELGKEYQIFGLRRDDSTAKEISAEGLYHPKRVDIGVKYRDGLIAAVGFKFVTSNYKQNSVNYFENLLGETANLQRGDIAFGMLFTLMSEPPYYDKHDNITKYETVTQRNLEKYLRLWRDRDFLHKPQALGIVFVDVDSKSNVVSGLTDVDNMEFDVDVKEFLKKRVNLESFFDAFVKLTKYRASIQQ